VNATLHIETRLLSEELRAFLQRIDPVGWRDGREAEATKRVEDIRSRLGVVAAAAEGVSASATASWLASLIAVFERAPAAPTDEPRKAWATFLREVQPAYDALAAWLRGTGVAVPAVRPTNYKRSFFHVCSALLSLALIRLLPEKWMLVGASGAFAVGAWSMEILRRRSPALNARLMRLFGPVAHAHEHTQVNSSTWYVTALLLLALFAPRLAAEMAVVVLGFADPFAGVVGRRFGRTRIRAGRSLEGSLTFVAVGTLAGLASAALFHPLALGPMLLLAGVGAVIGAVAEVLSTGLDDNFTIPVTVALGVTIAGAIARIPLV
jgi:dolichol kinase